jgi:hypothetical protein
MVTYIRNNITINGLEEAALPIRVDGRKGIIFSAIFYHGTICAYMPHDALHKGVKIYFCMRLSSA